MEFLCSSNGGAFLLTNVLFLYIIVSTYVLYVLLKEDSLCVVIVSINECVF